MAISIRNLSLTTTVIITAMFAWLALAPTGVRGEGLYTIVNGCRVDAVKLTAPDGRVFDVTGIAFRYEREAIIEYEVREETEPCYPFAIWTAIGIDLAFFPSRTPFTSKDQWVKDLGRQLVLTYQDGSPFPYKATDLSPFIPTPLRLVVTVKSLPGEPLPAVTPTPTTPTPTTTPPPNIGGACTFTPNGGTYTPGANGVVVQGTCPAAEAARFIQAASGSSVQALWALSGGLWRFFLPANPGIDGGLNYFPGPLASITVVLG